MTTEAPTKSIKINQSTHDRLAAAAEERKLGLALLTDRLLGEALDALIPVSSQQLTMLRPAEPEYVAAD